MSRKPETAIQARFGGALFERIEEWRRTQRRIPPLADTVRFLVKRGLDAEALENKDRVASTDGAVGPPYHTSGAVR